MEQTKRGTRPVGSQMSEAMRYVPGFRNAFQTVCLPGALPQDRTHLQKLNCGLYAGQFSVSPFTAPRGTKTRSWLHSVRHMRRSPAHRSAAWSETISPMPMASCWSCRKRQRSSWRASSTRYPESNDNKPEGR